MADADFWLSEYVREVNGYDTQVNFVCSMPITSDPRAASKSITDMESAGHRIKEIKKTWNIEIRLCRDRGKREALEGKFKEMEEKFKELEKNAVESKAKFGKIALLQGNKNINSTEGKSSDDLLNGARIIQDKTFESLGRSRSLIEESKQVGAATLDQLRAQREQMNDIEKEIDVMDSNLTRAGKLVTSFAKRMATDKFIQGFSVLNICVLVGLIIYLAVTGKSLSPNQDDDGPTMHAPTLYPTSLPTTSLPTTSSPTGSPT